MKLSFVIPCYRSENTIETVVQEIRETVATRPGTDYEIVLVNDCSPDGVWQVIKKLAVADNKIKGICLAKNFGQHSALMAGYGQATGDYIISLDDDGQTPASESFKLVDKLEEGYDVVYGYYQHSATAPVPPFWHLGQQENGRSDYWATQDASHHQFLYHAQVHRR